jgi:hypothetical protein
MAIGRIFRLASGPGRHEQQGQSRVRDLASCIATSIALCKLLHACEKWSHYHIKSLQGLEGDGWANYDGFRASTAR